MKTLRTPTYRLHRPTGQAVVTLNGRDHYLGRHGTPESRAEYDRLLAEWLANGRHAPAPPEPDGSGLTVVELIVAYVRHSQEFYAAPGGGASEELGNIKDALRPVRRLYGQTPAAAFGPLSLKAVRRSMIDAGLCRNTI